MSITAQGIHVAPTTALAAGALKAKAAKKSRASILVPGLPCRARNSQVGPIWQVNRLEILRQSS
eukprot:scaffold68587_cov16-Tisochrysis_lutea.AAC.1